MRSASMAISFVWCERRVSESLARSLARSPRSRSRSCDFERCASPCRCRAPPGWFATCYRPCGSPSPCAGTTTQQLQILRDLELGLLSSAFQPRVLFPIHRSSDHALCVDRVGDCYSVLLPDTRNGTCACAAGWGASFLRLSEVLQPEHTRQPRLFDRE